MNDVITTDGLTQDELRTLAELEPEPPVVSIFHPTDRSDPRPEVNSLHLKNALSEAERQLAEAGVSKPGIGDLLAAPRRLLDDADFWQHQLDGLAVYCAPDTFHTYRLPFPVDELVRTGDRPVIKPLVRGFAEGAFYVLQLSAAQVRLFKATRFGINEVDLSDADMPFDLATALRYDDLQKPETDHHIGTGPGRDAGPGLGAGTSTSRSGDRGRSFPGHGQGGDEHKDQLLQYFRLVDEGISHVLPPGGEPLVLAAVDYYHPLYREVAGNDALIEPGVVGNYDQANPQELHELAWERVESHFDEATGRAVDDYNRLAPAGRASCDAREVVEGAFTGRIHTLLVREGAELWGAVDLDNQRVETSDEQAPGTEDLIELLCRQTLLTAGHVRVLSPEVMPCDEPVGAVFRY